MQVYVGNGYVPPSPMGYQQGAGQPAPMFPVGMGTGYYNPNTYQFYNPWEVRKQQDQQIKQYNQAILEQIEMNKAIIRMANRYQGIETDEKALDSMFEQYKPTINSVSDIYDYYSKKKDPIQEIEQGINNNISPIIHQKQLEAISKIQEESEKRMQCEKGESQWDKLNEIYYDLRVEEMQQAQKDLSNRYNRSGYRNLISKTTDPVRAMFSNVNIDDMEITLPDGISQEYANRRAKFIAKLLGKG